MAVKVGVVGFGHLGQYLVDAILRHPHLYTLVFVWNRSAHVFDQYPHLQSLVLPDLADFKARLVNLITVELFVLLIVTVIVDDIHIYE